MYLCFGRRTQSDHTLHTPLTGCPLPNCRLGHLNGVGNHTCSSKMHRCLLVLGSDERDAHPLIEIGMSSQSETTVVLQTLELKHEKIAQAALHDDVDRYESSNQHLAHLLSSSLHVPRSVQPVAQRYTRAACCTGVALSWPVLAPTPLRAAFNKPCVDPEAYTCTSDESMFELQSTPGEGGTFKHAGLPSKTASVCAMPSPWQQPSARNTQGLLPSLKALALSPSHLCAIYTGRSNQGQE